MQMNYTFRNPAAKKHAQNSVDAALRGDRIAYLQEEISLLQAHIHQGIPADRAARAQTTIRDLQDQLQHICHHVIGASTQCNPQF